LALPIDPGFKTRVIAEFTAEWQFWVREDGSVEYISAGCERVSGYRPEELFSGKVRLRDYVHPDDFGFMRDLYLNAAEGKEANGIEFRISRKDGTVRWGSLSFVPVRDGDGRHLGFRGSIRDVTDRKNAEEALRRERDMLDKVVSSVGAGLSILDRSYRIVWYNSVIASFAGPLEKNRGKLCHDLFERSPAVCGGCPVQQALEQGQTARSERLGVVLPDGRTRDFLNIATPMTGPDGSGGHCLELVIDITDRRAQKAERERLREQLLRAQKLEAVGTLAGGIAHEFNNLLTGILGFTSLLRGQLGKDSPHNRPLEVIERSATQAASLTQQLLDFSRKSPSAKRRMGLNEVAGDVLAIVRQTFSRDIDILEELSPDLRDVHGDPGQLQQVLLNVCLNARDAMSDGGTLRVRTDNLDLDDGGLDGQRLEAGRYVLLSVADTGSGIPPQIRERVFEPFFTTKDTGKGTGMGLAVVYGIVQDHGGVIDFESRPGEGTTFRIVLPAAPLTDPALCTGERQGLATP
jgi:two-component system cell cycle sensor histidine kinase/response regulator CckA